jgi:hypothetical protein
MPVHDWSRVPVGLYHHFHQSWSVAICDALNGGLLPAGFFVLLEASGWGVVPDEEKREEPLANDPEARGGIALKVDDAPPPARLVCRATEAEVYAARANRLVIKNSSEQTVSVIEVVSPGNKVSKRAVGAFVERSRAMLLQGVHLLVIDLFPQATRDAQGLHSRIWGEPIPSSCEFVEREALIIASYDAGPPATAYVEPRAVGDELPDAAVFIEPERYVPVPLEATYARTWERCPGEFRRRVLDAIAG